MSPLWTFYRTLSLVQFTQIPHKMHVTFVNIKINKLYKKYAHMALKKSKCINCHNIVWRSTHCVQSATMLQLPSIKWKASTICMAMQIMLNRREKSWWRDGTKIKTTEVNWNENFSCIKIDVTWIYFAGERLYEKQRFSHFLKAKSKVVRVIKRKSLQDTWISKNEYSGK